MKDKTKAIALEEFNAGFFHFKKDDEIYVLSFEEHENDYEIFVVPYFIYKQLFQTIDAEDKDIFEVLESISSFIDDASLIREQSEKEKIQEELLNKRSLLVYYQDNILRIKRQIKFYSNDTFLIENFERQLKVFEKLYKETEEKIKELQKQYEFNI